MNKFQFILSILFVSLFAVSCGDDDDESPAPVSDIVGTWDLNSVDFAVEVNGVDFIDYFIDLFDLTEIEAAEAEELVLEEADVFETNAVFTFNADGTLIISEPGSLDEGGTYSLNSDESEITITNDGESLTADVVTLNNSQLVLSIQQDDSSEGDIDGDGSIDLISVIIDLGFSRIQ